MSVNVGNHFIHQISFSILSYNKEQLPRPHMATAELDKWYTTRPVCISTVPTHVCVQTGGGGAVSDEGGSSPESLSVHP